MNDADIRKGVLARDALRREAHLPPLDIEREVQRARDLAAAKAANRRDDALRAAYANEYDRIRAAVIDEKRAGGSVGFPSGSIGYFFLSFVVRQRFADFLATLGADEISSATSDLGCDC